MWVCVSMASRVAGYEWIDGLQASRYGQCYKYIHYALGVGITTLQIQM
jgi:hypothetical protein